MWMNGIAGVLPMNLDVQGNICVERLPLELFVKNESKNNLRKAIVGMQCMTLATF